MPYDYRHARPDQMHRRGMPDRLPHQGLTFGVIGWDSITKIIRGLRMVSVTPQFCDILGAEIDKLAKRAEQPTSTYDADVQKAYARWPQPDAMLKAAKYREMGGMPFPSELKGQPVPKGAN